MSEDKGDHFPDFHNQESRIIALEDAIRRNAGEWKAQREVHDALLDWLNGRLPIDTAARRLRNALINALK
jgi:hypothetical protein